MGGCANILIHQSQEEIFKLYLWRNWEELSSYWCNSIGINLTNKNKREENIGIVARSKIWNHSETQGNPNYRNSKSQDKKLTTAK